MSILLQNLLLFSKRKFRPFCRLERIFFAKLVIKFVNLLELLFCSPARMLFVTSLIY